MLYELRIYEATPGKVKALVERFADITVPMWKARGIRPTQFFEPVVGTTNQFIYLLEWESLAERERLWDAFQADPEWIAKRADTEKDGPLTQRITNMILREVPSIMAAVKGQAPTGGGR